MKHLLTAVGDKLTNAPLNQAYSSEKESVFLAYCHLAQHF